MSTMLRYPQRLRATPFAKALVLLLAISGSTARADLEFKQPSADAGAIKTGTALSHRFHFVNHGPDVAEITDARASCGCLTPRIAKRTFQVGESGDLQLDVNTLSQNAGPHTWKVHLAYRSGNTTYEIPLQLTALVVAEVTVQPASLTVFAENALSQEVLVTDLRPKPLSIADVKCSSPKLRPRLAGAFRNSLGHQVRKIHIELAEDYPEGRHSEVLDIVTDDPGYKELKVPVTIVKRARQRVSTLPSQVTIKAPEGQSNPSYMVRVRDNENQPVVIERVTFEHPAVACSWAQGPGPMSTLKVTIDRAKVQGTSLETTIQVHISQPTLQTLTLPVSCTLQ